jgi:hypothetical protein
MAGLILLVFTTSLRGGIPATTGASQPPTRALLLITALIYVVPAVWGIASSVGLWRLKNWARISTIVFAVFLATVGVFGVLIAVVMPIPVTPAQQNMPQIATMVRVFLGTLGAGELGIGLWLAIYFTRRRVQAQFARAVPQVVLGPADSEAQRVATMVSQNRRPVSLTVIACFLLVGAACFPFAFLMHTPLLVLGKVLTGTMAVAGLLLFTAANVSIGIGLLKLWPAARTAGIVYFLFALVNAGVSWLSPGAAGRMQAIIAAQPKMFGSTPEVVFPPQFIAVIGIASMLVTLVPLYFLITRKSAFEPTGA